MITNIGKNILAKYLLGQSPAFASYIAVGCGPRPIDIQSPGFTDQQKEEYADKYSLDFEMFRVPIISRGYVNEDGLVKLVLTAELPTEERYEITEVGIYSAGANPSAPAFDSRTVYSFTESEGWEYHTQVGVTEIPSVYVPLDSDNDNVISGEYIVDGSLRETQVFHTNADNRLFTNSNRVARNERCRILNNMTMVPGDMSNLIADQNGNMSFVSGSHIHITNSRFNFNRNAPTDELRLAFSVVNKDGSSAEQPDEVRVLVQFSESESSLDGQIASMSSVITSESNDFSTNRYFVSSKQLQSLVYSPNFNWDLVTVARVFVSIIKDGTPSSDYYLALDGMRLENVSTINPLYGLTGYSVIKTEGSVPFIKSANTSNFIEFRMSIGVE